jgi:hypothetical protein
MCKVRVTTSGAEDLLRGSGEWRKSISSTNLQNTRREGICQKLVDEAMADPGSI